MALLSLIHKNGKSEQYAIKAANRDGDILVATTETRTMYVPINNYEMVKIKQ